jgi:signal transduction histidine kinase
MSDRQIESKRPQSRSRKLKMDLGKLSRRILQAASAGTPRVEFFRDVSALLLEFTGCDEMEVSLKESDLHYRFVAVQRPKRSYRFAATLEPVAGNNEDLRRSQGLSGLDRLCRMVLEGRVDTSQSDFTKGGSFWTGDFGRCARRLGDVRQFSPSSTAPQQKPHKSLAIIRVVVEAGTVGLILLMSRKRGAITKKRVELYEDVAHTFGLAVADRRAHADLRERVKELTCLYGIAKVAEQPSQPLDLMFRRIVKLLPPAWQFPEEVRARIVLDGRKWATPGFVKSRYIQAADIVVERRRRGRVEVVYPENSRRFQESPFLPEEQNLIDAVARETGLIVYRKSSEQQQTKLQMQLRHADRLATIGQLAAGIAHELNEPLGGILGFAQLARKSDKLPMPIDRDLEKIVAATLHAREVVRKLLHFARRMPTKRTWIRFGEVVEEGLAFLEPRCARVGIELNRDLAGEIPEVNADVSQIQQVLVNLVVNAIQAMPAGGRLTVRTQCLDDWVLLIVEDTGVGMTREVQEQLFVPFFTTKQIGEGTGLGLPVVHGIVTAHGGSISVRSKVGQGSRFEIRLPSANSPAAAAGTSDGT